MKKEILGKLEAMDGSTEPNSPSTVRALEREYHELHKKETEVAKRNFVEDGGRASEFVYHPTHEDIQINTLLGKFKKIQTLEKDKVIAEQIRNLNVKTGIIKDIADLSKLDVNVSGAIKKIHSLQMLFKSTGNVPTDKQKEVMADYNRVVEAFYFGLKLYNDSQLVDRKKNYDAKRETLEKLRRLIDQEKIKEVEQSMRALRIEWEEIGPVPQESWIILKDEFKVIWDQLTEKIKGFYGLQRDFLKGNLEAKRNLTEKTKIMLASLPATEKDWEMATEKIIALQNEYKMAGRTENGPGDLIWKEFRAACDSFFEKKKEYFEVLRSRMKEIRAKKEALLLQADQIKGSEDWQKSTEVLMDLQTQWKKLPKLMMREEQKLFEKFRAACNHFFDAKKGMKIKGEEALADNVKFAEEIIEKMVLLSESGKEKDGNELSAALYEILSLWKAKPKLTGGDERTLSEKLYVYAEKLFDAVAWDEQERKVWRYKIKLGKMENSDPSGEVLRKELDYVKKQISNLQHELNTLENNMGFFKFAKTKSAMQVEMESKIESGKSQVGEWKKKQDFVKGLLNAKFQPKES